MTRTTVSHDNDKHRYGIREFLQYVGPGLLVTIGFIDPGNWAANMAAGSVYGYELLWVVTLSTVMLIVFQHNAAHLGIATGLCLAEAATLHLQPPAARAVLGSAVLAAVSTALAEILGGAIALNMLCGIPVTGGAVITACAVLWMLFTNSYGRLEKLIIAFVSLIGASFLFEVSLVDIPWKAAARGWVVPVIPEGSMVIVMSVLGAVVMPHNLFLHSEVIQSRQWNLENDTIIKRQLRYEFMDTLFGMAVGWAINSAMILVAAACFFSRSIPVTELQQAQEMLTPLLGKAASVVFALALLFSGLSSTATAGLAGGSIVAGIYGRPYDIRFFHSKAGVGITLLAATGIIFFIGSPFRGPRLTRTTVSHDNDKHRYG
ncbi:MAG: Nramp family divalent metal transporter, partial [Pseudomonadota bacterium]